MNSTGPISVGKSVFVKIVRKSVKRKLVKTFKVFGNNFEGIYVAVQLTESIGIYVLVSLHELKFHL